MVGSPFIPETQAPNTEESVSFKGNVNQYSLELVKNQSFFNSVFMVGAGKYYQTTADIIKDMVTGPENGPSTGSNFMNLDPFTGKPSTPIETMMNHPVNYGFMYYTKGLCRDTTLGGNDAINCYWQYNENDDLAHPYTSAKNVQMGRVYAETINAVQSILYLGFGVPEFNTLSGWANNFYSPPYAEGVYTGWWEKLTSALWTGVTTPLRILRSVNEWLKVVDSGAVDAPVTNFYCFRSLMPAYYSQVQTLLISISTNMDLMEGLNPVVSPEESNAAQTHVEIAKEMGYAGPIPEIITRYNLDMGEIVARRSFYDEGNEQAIKELNSRKYLARLSEFMKSEQGGGTEGNNYVQGDASNKYQASKGAGNHTWFIQATAPLVGLKEKQPWWFNPFAKGDMKFWSQYGRLSTLFIGFRVERGNNASESLSSSTQPSSIQQALNSILGRSMQTNYYEQGGASGHLAALLADKQSYLMSLTGKIMGSFGFSSLGGNVASAIGAGISMADIPEVWSDSQFSTSYSFNMQFIAPYGDPLTILQTLYVPLACLLAGAAPRATGLSSYTSPFLCQAYCRGKFAVALGMIDSLSIDRGSSSHGWTHRQLPRTLDVSFSIKDLLPNMPIGLLLNSKTIDGVSSKLDIFQQAEYDINKYLTADTTLSRYLMTLAGMGPNEMLIPSLKMRARLQEIFRIKHEVWYNSFFNSLDLGYKKTIVVVSNLWNLMRGRTSDLHYATEGGAKGGSEDGTP